MFNPQTNGNEQLIPQLPKERVVRIITTTYEDFIKCEIAEHGHDYVEAQFMLGYEPE